MRWIFLCCIALLAAIGNVAIFERMSILRAGGGLAFNVFVASLVVIWRNGYFGHGHRRARGLMLGHALLVLAAALGLLVVGLEVVMSDSCEPLMRARRPNGLRNQMLSYIGSSGYCREVGYGILALGMYLSYPCIRLFTRMSKDADTSL